MSLEKIKNQSESLKGRRFLIIGYGGLGRTYLELLNKIVDETEVYVFDPHLEILETDVAFSRNTIFVKKKIDQQNYQSAIDKYLRKDDVLVNLSNSCSSQDLISFCFEKSVTYLDTAWGSWREHGAAELPLAMQGKQIKACKEKLKKSKGSMALVNFGLNPGLISAVAKKAFRSSKESLGFQFDHIIVLFTEYDAHRANDSVGVINSWSPTELWSELVASSEYFVRDDFRQSKTRAIENEILGWTPSVGTYKAYLVPHREIFSFVESLPSDERKCVAFSGFCYHPPSSATLGVKKQLAIDPTPEAIQGQVICGEKGKENFDEVGVLVGKPPNWFWCGYSFYLSDSRLHQVSTNSTLYLVAASALIGLLVALRSEKRGLLEAEDLDEKELLELANSFFGPLVSRQPDSDFQDLYECLNQFGHNN